MNRFGYAAVLLVASTICFRSNYLPARISNPLIDLLKSPSADVRARAARDLGKSGDTSAIPALAGVLNDPSEKVRREAIAALASIRVPESLDPLISATQSRDPKDRELAVRGLVAYYTGQTVSVGFTGFVRKTWQRARSRFGGESLRIDPGVVVEPKVISALIAVMEDPRAIDASRKAAEGLGILVAGPAVPDLVKAAHSSDKDLALEALDALAKIKDVSAGPQLVDLLDSANEEVKQEAAVTVGILRTGQALPKLQAMYQNNPDKRTRERALEGLAYLGDPISVPLFIRALWSAEPSMRTFGAEGLARAGDPKPLPDLEKAVHVERDGDAKLAMQFALTALGKGDFLSTIVDDLGSRLRGDSAQAYLIELSRDKAFLPRLYPYLNSPNATVRRRLCTVLMYTGDQASLDQLERLSHDSNGEVASESLRATRAIRVRLSRPSPSSSPAGSSN